MQRTTRTYSVESVSNLHEKLLRWAQQYQTAIWLDSNKHHLEHSNFDNILAIEEFTSIQTDAEHAFEKLKEYQTITQDYLFGYLSYDVKNASENLTSTNVDDLGFAELFFFQPQKILFIKDNRVEFRYLSMVEDEIDTDFKAICDIVLKPKKTTISNEEVEIRSRISKKDYLKKVDKILEYIHKGDIYEVNFCQEFYAENTSINPLDIYEDLNTISEAPFATFLKIDHQFLLCASPERYLKKEGRKIISQPIKGTAKRFKNRLEDQKTATALSKDTKERSENIMIVDLVRNDLSKSAKKGSVQVEELCKVSSFKQVHQMISTVVSEIKDDVHLVDVIKDTFPMGSMTGAPKISAMKIIESLEETKRGLYSGTVGYFTPNGNFDFNVVIRSILYDAEKKYLSFSVGSAVTAKSSPEKEYEECLLKAKAMQFVLTNSNEL
jgi:para-aminobenzoate synthetase component 1